MPKCLHSLRESTTCLTFLPKYLCSLLLGIFSKPLLIYTLSYPRRQKSVILQVHKSVKWHSSFLCVSLSDAHFISLFHLRMPVPAMTSVVTTPSLIHATRTIGSTGKRSLQIFFITRVYKSRVPDLCDEYFIYCVATVFWVPQYWTDFCQLSGT